MVQKLTLQWVTEIDSLLPCMAADGTIDELLVLIIAVLFDDCKIDL